MTKLIKEQRQLLLRRLDVLTANLKKETDSARAELILHEMRNIGKLLQELVNNPVPNHPSILIEEFKEHARNARR